VFGLAVSGRPNKELAVGLSEMTAKIHRSQVAKIKAISIVELVRMADRPGIFGG
jgi:FixJ family two-component response regulator